MAGSPPAWDNQILAGLLCGGLSAAVAFSLNALPSSARGQSYRGICCGFSPFTGLAFGEPCKFAPVEHAICSKDQSGSS
jgi:hypothetical protein